MIRRLAAVLIAACATTAPAQVDSELPVYKPAGGVSGSIKSMGSDTMNNLMTFWAGEFKTVYPNVTVEIEGKGSSTGPPAITNGQAQFAPMSREMKSTEVGAFVEELGYEPTELAVAVDCLAVYVHKDCPLEEISVDQLTRLYTVEGPELTWDQLGVTDPAYRGKRVSLYGRNSASGTYGFFKDRLGADFKNTVKEQPGSSAVVQAVGTDRYGIGYSGIGYKTADVRPLRVSYEDGAEAFDPSLDHAYSGDYPIARFLYVYVNKDPRTPLDPLRAEFIRLIYSRSGQEIVLKDGYYPVTPSIAREQLLAVDLDPGF